MSPKQKKKAGKPKAIKSKMAPAKPVRRLSSHTSGNVGSISKAIPSAANAIPCVSKAMPEAATAIPLVSREIPLISDRKPLVSTTPQHTIARKWGLPGKQWGTSKIPASRKRGVKRPTDIGLFKALGQAVVSPVMGPMKMVHGLAITVKSQAEEETEPETALEQKLLEHKMRLEMGAVSEENNKGGKK
ncbi:MAG: hypothetical protein L6437_05870 [Kiritimatiellae bacterium]|nr:hypothetical protein [Kiritimatiellia bacterium]